MAQEIKMSAAGLKAMQEELEYLKTVRRKELAEEIKEARSHGDLSENSKMLKKYSAGIMEMKPAISLLKVRRGQEYAGSGGEPHHRTGADDQERRHH